MAASQKWVDRAVAVIMSRMEREKAIYLLQDLRALGGNRSVHDTLTMLINRLEQKGW